MPGESERLKSPACSVAVPVLPVPPLVELTLPVVLTLGPAVVGVTFALSVHEAPAATLPPVRLMLFEVLAAVPPQVVLRLAVAATASPEGNVSVIATPVSAAVVFGLVMVRVKLVVPFTATVPAPNALLTDGGATISRLAVAEFPVPASLLVTAEVVLFAVPATFPVTFTENVQLPAAISVPPVRLIPLPEAAIVPVPQLPVSPFGLDTARLLGKVSVKPTPLSATVAFGFVTVKLRLVVPFSGMLDAPNDLLNDGGASTVMLAMAVFPVPALLELTVALLFLTPAVVPSTVVETEQLAPAARLPPLRLSVPPPLLTVAVPPQVLVADVPETIKPAGKTSVN